MNNYTNMADNTKEIDIIEVFTGIYFFVRRYYLIFVFSILIGLVFGLYYHYKKNPYESNILIGSILKGDALKEVLEYSAETNTKFINTDVKYEYKKDTSQLIIVAKVKTYDKEILNPLYDYLLESVKNNQYLKNRYDFIINSNNKLISELNKQVEFIKNKQFSDSVNCKTNIKYQSNTEALIVLYDRIYSSEELLNNSKDIIYKISDFSEPQLASQSILITIAIFVFIFVFLGILAASTIEAIKIARKRQGKQSI